MKTRETNPSSVDNESARPVASASSRNGGAGNGSQAGRISGQADLWSAIGSIIDLQGQSPPLESIARDGSLPLSFAQDRLWLLAQSDAQSSAYNVPLTWRIRGNLDRSVLEKSLQEIVRRHEVLRASFPSVDGQPSVVILPTMPLPLLTVDVAMLPEAEREAEALRRATEEARRPFVLSEGPLLRTILFHLGESEHLLLVVVHQIVFDGASKRVFNRELTDLYAAFATGHSSPLPELHTQYVDFAGWQRRWLQGEVLHGEVAYWRDKLRKGFASLRLPADHPRAPVATAPANQQAFGLSEALTRALVHLAHAENTTLFVVILAAWQALLHAYSEQEDILVFTSMAGRTRLEIKNLIGLFANVVPLSTDFAGVFGFRELLGRVRQVVLEAYAHQLLPLDMTLKVLQSEGSIGHAPLFQAMVIFENAPLLRRALPDLLFLPSEEIDTGTVKFDLLLHLVETTHGLVGSLTYRADLFEESTISRLLGGFQALLEEIVASPDTPLSAIPTLSKIEQQRPAVEQCTTAPCVLTTGLSGALPDSGRGQPHVPDRAAAKAQAEFVAPRDALELQMTQIWEQVLAVHPVGLRDNFFELGGHSLLAARLFERIYRLTGKNLPLTTLFQAPTVEALASLLRQEGWTAPWSSLVPIQPGGSRPPLFCMHVAGGHVLFYRDLAHHLGPDQPFYALQPLDGDLPRPTRVEEMAAHYIQEIRNLQPEGPYYLGGSSLGGLIAFEMAQQLHSQGQKVALLALFDTPTPEYSRGLSKITVWQRLDLHLQNLMLLGPREKLIYLRDKARRGRWMMHDGLAYLRYKAYVVGSRPLPSDLARYESTEASPMSRYLPRVYPGHITLFRATKRPRGVSNDPTLGWAEMAGGGLEVHDVPGYHGTIMVEPRVRVLAEKLIPCLDRAQSSRGSGTAVERQGDEVIDYERPVPSFCTT